MTSWQLGAPYLHKGRLRINLGLTLESYNACLLIVYILLWSQYVSSLVWKVRNSKIKKIVSWITKHYTSQQTILICLTKKVFWKVLICNEYWNQILSLSRPTVVSIYFFQVCLQKLVKLQDHISSYYLMR